MVHDGITNILTELNQVQGTKFLIEDLLCEYVSKHGDQDAIKSQTLSEIKCIVYEMETAVSLLYAAVVREQMRLEG